MSQRLMLVDTAGLYFRAFHGVPISTVSPGGTPVNAVRGTLDALARLISTYQPDLLVACWDDDWRPQWRVDLLPSYKTHRVADETLNAEDVPDLLEPQVRILAEVLDALGIARVGAHGCEADDVIGTLTARHQGLGPVDIVTGDRDLFQLVHDAEQVRVVYTGKGVAKADLVDESFVAEKFGIPGRSYAQFAVLRGDASDGLPGVPGVGNVTAASLVREFETIEGVLDAASSGAGMSAGLAAKILSAADYLAVAPEVVRVMPDAALPDFDPAIPASNALLRPAEVVALVERWGLGSSANRLLNAMDSLQS